MTDAHITERIRGLLAEGRRKEEIYQTLLAEGISIADIEAGFAGPTQEAVKRDTHQWAVRVIVSIGVLLIAAGIFSFIAANWDEISRAGKVGLILAAMTLSYGAGWYLKEFLGYTRSGEALIFLGSIAYGGGIFLVAQLFNVQVEWPDGFILWMLGTLVMALAVDSYLLYYLAMPVGAAALVGHPLIMVERFWSTGGPSNVPFSLVLLILAVALTFTVGWLIRRKMPEEQKKFY